MLHDLLLQRLIDPGLGLPEDKYVLELLVLGKLIYSHLLALALEDQDKRRDELPRHTEEGDHRCNAVLPPLNAAHMSALLSHHRHRPASCAK